LRHFLPTVCLGLCLAASASSQTNPTAVQNAAQKFDEFGDVYPTDAAARLDNFAIQLQHEPNKAGFIIGYRSYRDLPGLSGRRVNWMRSHLIYSRGIKAERIKAIDGGEAGCLTTEFWIVPVGTAPTPRADAYSRGFDDLEVAPKFDEYAYTIPEDMLDSYSTDYEDGLEGFANALRKEPRSLAYIIAYSQYRLEPRDDQKGRTRHAQQDPQGTALKELKQKKAELVKTYGISSSRIRLVEGGYRNWRAIEFWIVPRGAYAPVPTPNVFPKRRAVL
jgi:hypothetical protein